MVARLLRASAAGVATLLLALVGVVAVQAPAFACTCTSVGFQKQVNRADLVFVGDVQEVGAPDRGQVTYAVLADRVYKGELDSAEVEVSSAASPGACGLGELPTGTPYLFLTTGGVTSICHGSAPADTEVLERVQRVLGAGTAAPVPPPETATRTRVEESSPREFSRLAAPGAALVLLGLLGLLVVRRVERS